jgi:uncharacterized membrane protein YfcA
LGKQRELCGGLWSESVTDCNDEVGLKISQKGLYALQAMMMLARRYQQGAIKVRDIASEADVPGNAGTLSGLLGIGSGAMKVLAMDQAMKIPFKVSTTTSNFMIGVTAAASAGVYLARGYIDPGLSMPVVLGVLAGSLLGTRVLVKADTKWLRRVFSIVIVVLGIEMLYKGLSGRI